MGGRSLEELLEAVAAQTPAPGGGAAAAWGCALAASLVEMSTGSERARALRVAALELAERDARVYGPVVEAQRAGRDPGAALSAAADSTLDIARAACEVAELAAEAATTGRRALRGDAAAGALLAEAACRAAAHLTGLNLTDEPNDPRLAEAAELAERAAAARAAALAA
jgi:formiminotetrahydrofolate cyclodeaminase